MTCLEVYLGRPALSLVASLLLMLSGAAVSSGCATGPGGKATDVAADVLLPPKQEEKLGNQMRQDVLKEVEVLDNPRIQQYVDELGRKAVRSAGRYREIPQGIDFSFTVIDEPETINAFAMPGGEIFVYTGLLKAVDSESELMAVLAHEVAHVTERHVAERLVAAYGLNALAGAALGNNPGLVSELVANVAAQGYLLKHSRSQESEADRTGIKYMSKAGYDPKGMISFFQEMQQQGGPRPPEFLSSHPLPETRVREARKIISNLRSPGTQVNQQRYQQMVQGL